MMISVLYVDDEQSLLEIAGLFLEETGGFQVRTAISAPDALKDDSIRSYDAIISDYQMPGMDGIAFLKVVRERYGDVPFILFTGRGREEVVIEAINNGADFYLQKGGDPEAQFAELAHKIRQAVRRKQAEYSLHDSERRLADIIDFLPDATFAIDRSGHVIAWNRAIEEMAGVPAAEMLGKGDYAYAVPFYGEPRPILIDLIDEPDENIRSFYTKIYRTGTSLTAETDLPHPKGRPMLVLAKVCHLYNQSGEITGAIESIRDISEHKKLEMDLEKKHQELQASYEQVAAADEELRGQYDELAKSEQQIRESETRYRSIIVNSPLGMHFYTLEPDGRLIFTGANPSADRILGIDHARLTAKPIEEAFPSLEATEIPERYKAVAEHGGIWQKDQVDYDRGEIRGAFAVIAFQTHPRSMVAVFEEITERRRQEYQQKRAEDACRKTEAQLQRLAENAPDMIYRMALPGGRYEYVSPASAAITGYTPEEFYAEPGLIRKLIHPDWNEYLENQWQALLENRAPPFFEYQILDKAGRLRWVNQRNVIVTDAEGNVVAIEGIVTDITRQKTTERELRRSELRSLAVSANAGEWIWEVDADGVYRYSSPAVTKILGYLPEELVGKMHYYDLFDPAVRETLKAQTTAGFGSHEPFRDFLNLNRHKNGSPVILSTSATPVFDDAGAFTGYCGVDEDITEKQRAQEILAESRQQLAGAMELAHLVNWEYDVDPDLFIFNDRFYALYGTTADREGGTRMSSETYAREFVHPDDRWMVADEVRKALGTTDPDYISHVEHRIIRRDGEIRYISVRIAITKDSRGRTIRTHGANQDITERRQAEEALRQAHRKLHLLTGITRHDISKQLTTLNGYIGFLHKKVTDPSAEPYFSHITEASRQINAMISFTKEYEKIGVHAPVWQAPAAVMGDAAKGILPGQIILKNDLPPTLEVFADPLIVKVFYNLLDNSIRHGQRVTEITVSARRSGEDMVVVWEDDGIGIEQDDKERIFERGFGKHTGLGMFLVREILSLTGITIRETGEPFVGARFEMVIPRGAYRDISP